MFLARRVPALILCSLLSACAASGAGPIVGSTTGSTVGPAESRTPATGQTIPPLAGTPRDLQNQAHVFGQMVAVVEPVAESECRRRAPQLDCDFRIVVDDRRGMPPNAFQTRDAAGRPVIAFTLALIAEAQNADELAFVLSHEAAHHILGHLDRQSRNATIGAAVFGNLASLTGPGDEASIRSAQELGAALGARSYSKEFELEADALGTIIAARAGYDPLRGAQFFARIPDPGNRFLGTHPPNADRIAVVQRTLAGL